MTERIDPDRVGLRYGLDIALPMARSGVAAADGRGAASILEKEPGSKKRANFDPVVVGRVVQMALAGGLPVSAGLALAIDEVGEMAGAELKAVLRSARSEGMAAAMVASTGPLLTQLFGRLALAQSSGAPMLEAVAGYLADARAARREMALEQARRLPVTLMIPLGLLILPGFVLLFVGPIVLNSLMDLSGSLP